MTRKMHLYYDKIIRPSVESRIDKCNAVYSDEIINDTGITREIVTRWLKSEGFTHPANHGCRWVKAE